MKRIGYVFLAEVVLTGVLVTLAGAQSQPLGDYARAVRKEDKKEAAKKYDNDNLPKTDKISIVGTPRSQPAAEDANPGSPADAKPREDYARPPSLPRRRRRTPPKRRKRPTQESERRMEAEVRRPESQD